MMRPGLAAVATAVALAVRAVLHGDQAELDQVVVDLLGLRGPEAERLLLHLGRGPDDRPRAFFPVLRLGEAEQPVDGVHQPRRNAEPRRGGLEGGQQLPGDSTPSGSPAKLSAERSALSSPGVSRRKPVGAWAKPPRCAPWALCSCAIVIPLSG